MKLRHTAGAVPMPRPLAFIALALCYLFVVYVALPVWGVLRKVWR